MAIIGLMVLIEHGQKVEILNFPKKLGKVIDKLLNAW